MSGGNNGWRFVDTPRRGPAERVVDERLADWREVYRGDDAADEVIAQASRCMDCGVPFCHQGCPLGNPIPDFNTSVQRGRWRQAYEQLAATNNFPELTGRLCPAPCEGACVLGIDPDGLHGGGGWGATRGSGAGGADADEADDDASGFALVGAAVAAGSGAARRDVVEHHLAVRRDAEAAARGVAPSLGKPVTIEHVERAIIERAFAEGWVVARAPTTRSGRRVAVVGSGPAGLAAATQLNRAGHEVTIFEAHPRAGGLLRYGIPDFKLEKHVIDRRLALLQREGVKLRYNVRVGADERWDALRERHDALLIATGAERARELDVPGADLDGVTLAMPYLTQQNRLVAGESLAPGERRLDARGKRVVILGGGDTGSDCLGTALRQGAASAQQIELFPAPPARRAADNPWPQWPLIMCTSSSQAEGGERDFGVMTKRLVGDEEGRLVALEAVRVALERAGDGPGERPRLHELAGSEHRFDVDLLVLALGFVSARTETLVEQLGVALDPRGNVAADGFATNVDGVFCAGDARRGASLVVWAIAEGREAARAVDSYLRRGRPSALPTRGRDQSFGGR